MKTRFAILLLMLTLSIFTYNANNHSVVATENVQTVTKIFKSEEEKTLEERTNNTLSDLDLSAYQNFLDELNTENISIKQLLNDILHNNNQLDFNYFLKFSFNMLFQEFSSLLPKLAIIIVVVILFGVLQKLTSSFNKQPTQKLVFIACYGIVLTVLLYIMSEVIVSTVKTIMVLSRFIDITFPILLTLTSALGANAAVSVYQPLVLIFSGMIFKIINVVILPLFYISFVFGIIGNLSDELKLSKFAKTAKKTAEWVLGIVFSLFITFLTAQGITGASFDSVSAKGAKFALSSYVPIVGGHLKEGFDLIIASCLVIKNAFGLCAIIVLLFIIIMPIIKLLIISLSLRLAASILEPISDSKFADVLESSSNSLMILIAILVSVFFALFIFIMLIIYTCNMGVV